MTLSQRPFILPVLLSCLAAGLTLHAQEEDPDYAFGLLGTLKDSAGHEVHRVDEHLSFRWGSLAADERLEAGEFEGHWRGQLLVRSRGAYRFFIHLEGEASLWLNGELVIEGAAPESRWLSGVEKELDFGFQPIEIRYKQTGKGARMALFWSGPTFALEPLGRRHLFHDREITLERRFERGRQLIHALRCQACHAIPAVPEPLPAPSLKKIEGNYRPEFLVQWLLENPQAHGANRRMPEMGLTAQQAKEVAAFLYERSEETGVESDDLLEKEDEALAAGERLFLTTGCLACHKLSGLGSDGLFAGPDLSTTASRRPDHFFARWLREPGKINPHHRMPQFALDEQQRRALGLFLASQGDKPEDRQAAARIQQEVIAMAAVADRVAAGRRHYEKLRCAACHDPGDGQTPKDGGALQAESNWEHGCQSGKDARAGLPRYHLSKDDQESIGQYVQTVLPTAPSTSAPASLAVAARGCLACHAREGTAGLAPQLPAVAEKHAELASLLPAMTPPALTGVGDKLTDKALRNAVARKGNPHRPWLHVQMPAFRFTDGEMNRLTQWLVDADRIPDGAPEAFAYPENHDDKATTSAGSRLVSTAGFGCTSCHDVGGVAPPKAPLNARGPDLTSLAERIRRPWYERWVRNPKRIVANMEMPSVQLAVKGVLGDKLADQLDAVWYVLNKPDFTPPRPGAVRVVRRAGLAPEPAAVLTDVLQLNGAQYIKPLVIGLYNRHNVLLDFESHRLIDWWQGDVSSQRTRGKTWFWETTTSSWLSGRPEGSELLLLVNGKEHAPTPRGQFVTEADGWSHESAQGGLKVAYRLKFDLGEELRWLAVEQLFQPWKSPRGSGFERHYQVSGLRSGEHIRIEVFQPGQLTSRIVASDRSVLLGADARASIQLLLPDSPESTLGEDGSLVLSGSRAGQAKAVLQYLSRVPVDQFPVKVELVEPPPVKQLNVIPGVKVTRLPLIDELMPTGLSWRKDGTLFISSLKGRVWTAVDSDNDGLEDRLRVFSDELAAPFGIVAHDNHVDVLNKYALLRLHDRDGDGTAEQSETVASGWGHTADYHDWIVGIARDRDGNYYVASPCQQDDRSAAAARLRGEVLQLSPRKPTADNPQRFDVNSLTKGHRFPIGIARNRNGDLFVTDNQGNYNPFNELNHVVAGRHYGFINKLDRKPDFHPPLTPPTIDIPHPWTRSVNGICFLDTPEQLLESDNRPRFGPWEGHLVGCEYDTRRMVRMSLQRVGDTLQGAVYPLTTEQPQGGEPLLGPLACAVSPRGHVYVGSIRDSGWGGANNIGTLVRMAIDPEQLPAGIAEVQANAKGLRIQFTQPVDAARASDPASYTITSYTRVSTPAYGGPDRDRATHQPVSITLSDDRQSVQLNLEEMRAGFVYDLKLKTLVDESQVFFPAEAYYTMRVVPAGP